ncbi:MAG: hypothetical protein ABSB18_04490 [Candidatus Omnitrophota bacterium]
MKFFKMNFSDVQLDLDLRCDTKFYDFVIIHQFRLTNKKTQLIKLKDILTSEYRNFDYAEGEEYSGVPTSREFYDDDGEVIDTIPVTKENHPGRIKYSVKEGQLLISSVKSARVPPILVKKKYTDYAFSNGFYIFNVDSPWSVKFIYYLLRSKKFRSVLDNHLCRGIGISTYTERDLLRIKIPYIKRIVQDSIVLKIEKIEKKIKTSKKLLDTPQAVIERILLKGLDFNEKEYQKRDKNLVFTIKFSELNESNDLRIGVNFHNPKFDVLDNFFNKYKHSKLQLFLDTPSRLGISPEYDESGEAYYLTMAVIKTSSIDLEDCEKVSDEFYNLNKDSVSLRRNDLLLARSGEGTIGKVAFCEQDFPNIYCDFTMRIRPNKRILPKWLYYYMRTKIFQLQILKWRKGMGNLTNIFPSQVDKLLIIDKSNNQQKQDVDVIDGSLKKVSDARNAQESMRQEICELVLNSLA